MVTATGDVKVIIAWTPLLLLVMGITFGVLDPLKTSMVPSLIQWMLFFSVGAHGIWGWLEHTFYPRTTAKSVGWASSPFQFEVASANLGTGIAGLLAPWFGQEYWLALIIIESGFLWGVAYSHAKPIFLKKKFSSITNKLDPTFYMDLLVPAVLILLYALL